MACNQTWPVTKHEQTSLNWPESVLYLPFNSSNRTNHIARTLHVPWDYQFIPRSHGTINLKVSSTFTVTVIQPQLSQMDLYLPVNSPNRTNHIARTIPVTWDYQFIPRFCRTINLNICLIFTVTIKDCASLRVYIYKIAIPTYYRYINQKAEYG